MKKSLVVTLALVFVLGIAGTAFANPYSDVPAGHWAYKAVVDLQKAGVMEGANGKFMGNQTLTRYEIAAITARAMAKADKADAATKATIDKLAVEFSKELNDLGVRVAKLEKSSSNIKWTGELRTRVESTKSTDGVFQNADAPVVDEQFNSTQHRLRLTMTANLDDNWKFVGRLAAEPKNINKSTSLINDKEDANGVVMDQAYVTGKIGEFTANVGRMPNPAAVAIVSGSSTNWDGVTLAGGSDLGYRVGYLKKAGYNAISNNDAKMGIAVADLTYAVDNSLKLAASYMADDATDKTAQHFADVLGFGVTYTGIQDFTLSAQYAENKATEKAAAAGTKDTAKASVYTVKYKGASYTQPGTFGLWVSFVKADDNYDTKGIHGGPDNVAQIIAGNTLDNVKGTEIGFEYGLFKNAVFDFKALNYDVKAGDNKGKSYGDIYIAEVTYKF